MSSDFSLPESLDDRVQLDNFVKRNVSKKILVVQGLGFVGSVMSIVCANAPKDDYAVIGVDLPNESFWKIKSINEGVFPFSGGGSKN